MESKHFPGQGDAAGRSPCSRSRLALAVLLPLLLVNAFLNTGCSSTEKPSTSAANGLRYIVVAEETPFYKYGPAQANGADMKLKKGRELVMLDRRYGYSRVQTEDGDAGYVPTDDLAPSPHQASALAQAPLKKTGAGGPRGGGRTPVFDQPNDAALPSQSPSDEPVPSFRY